MISFVDADLKPIKTKFYVFRVHATIQVYNRTQRQELIQKFEAELDRDGWLTEPDKLFFKELKNAKGISANDAADAKRQFKAENP